MPGTLGSGWLGSGLLGDPLAGLPLPGGPDDDGDGVATPLPLAAPVAEDVGFLEPFTLRWWWALPAVYRAADEAQTVGPDALPLLRFMSLLGDQADRVRVLRDRFALHPDPDNPAGPWVSDLANPATADAAWLPWQAQLAGVGLHAGPGTAETFNQLVVDYPTFAALAADNANYIMVRHHALLVGGGTGPETLRAALLDLTGARYAGSTGAWERLITPLLVGRRRVRHSRIHGGDPWHLELATYDSETPNPDIVAAVIGDAAHAAGLTVTYELRAGAAYDDLPDAFATFDGLAAGLPNFDALAVWTPL